MSSLNGFAGSVTGTTGSANTVEPKSGWYVYVLPRGGHAAAASTGSVITFDSQAVKDRFAARDYIQVGTNVSSITQIATLQSATGATLGLNASVTVAQNDRILIVGTTAPTVTGGSASYQPNTTIYPRDDDGSTPTANSVVSTSSDGFYQFWKADGLNDLLVQDNNRACVGIIPDVQIGIQPTSDFVPSTTGINLGTCASPFSNLVISGRPISGITSAAGRTYWDFRTCDGVTQGNLFAFGISNQAPKVYGDTWGGIFQSWSLPQCFNAKSSKYGAKGDNSSDDTTAIQAALNDAAAGINGTSGGLVFLPRGTYIVNSTLTVPTKVRLVGEGRSAVVIKAGGSFSFDGVDDAVIQIGNTTENAHGSRIENLAVDCNDIANSIGVYSSRANELSGVENCQVLRARLYGIFMSGANTANFDIENVEIGMSDSAGASSKGVYLLNSVGAMKIDSATINNYSGSGTNIGVGIHLDHGGGHSPMVTNCHIEACTIGIRLSSNDAVIHSNTGHNTTPVLLAIDSGMDAYDVRGLFTAGSATGISDSVLGWSFTDTISHTVHSSLNHVRSSTGVFTETFGTTTKFVGTVIGNSVTTLTCGTALSLPAGNLFGLSSSPAGSTTVTSFSTVHNGRRVTFYGMAGTVTFSDGNNIKTDGASVAVTPNDIVEFMCVGTTWCQVATKLAL